MQIIYILLSVLCLFVVYAVIPNILVRVWHFGCVWRIPEKRCVCLTFDDGPDPDYTPQVLDVLHDAGVQATFFVIAEKALKQREIILRMIREGHDVQVHGYTHTFVPALTPLRTRKQVLGAAAALNDVFGVRTSLYRPTWGLCNLATLVFLLGNVHKLVIWSIMVGDWRRTNWEVLLSRIMSKLHPGAIIVLHDSDETFGSETGAPNEVIKMLPKLIERLQRAGYEMVKVVDHV